MRMSFANVAWSRGKTKREGGWRVSWCSSGRCHQQVFKVTVVEVVVWLVDLCQDTTPDVRHHHHYNHHLLYHS
ncbi:hypothetical protein E2C01_091837 [Portunus trituberculatus]|uniref:Uncharacterized protein n=1 Tax=Portunus trituberculatus TaxID=210409 RepID=A0A5B7JF04_PORTR|nr:hypothetical protein [Portunus trituberculatus]